MKVLSFNFNHKLLYPFFYTFCFLAKQLLNFQFCLIKNGSIYSLLISSAVLLFSLIPYFIILKRKRLHNSKQSISLSGKQQTIFKQVQAQHYDKTSHYLLIFGLGLLFLVLQFAESELLKTYLWFYHNSCQSLFGSMFAVIFCNLIFHTPLYRHNKVALFIMLFIGIVLTFFYVEAFFLDTTKPILSKLSTILICGLLIICDPIREVYEKYMMENHLMNTFSIMIAEGLIGTIFGIIFLLITSFSDIILDIFILLDNEGNPMLDFKITWANFYIFIGFAVFAFLANHLRLKSNELFHPIQRYSFVCIPYILLSLSSFISYFVFQSMNEEMKKKLQKFFFIYFGKNIENTQSYQQYIKVVVEIIISVTWFLCATLLNEVIILYFCDLHKQTKVIIENRGDQEVSDAMIELDKEENFEYKE